jgi:ComF family protein
MSLIKHFIFLVKDFLFPTACALCGGSLAGISEIQYGLCDQCRSGTACVAGEKCNLCGKPLISERDVCLPCRNGEEKSYDRLWTLFPYTGKFRKLLKSYKFAKNLPLADFFAEKILELFNANPVLRDACIVPVPPRPGKIKDTGWDQIDCLVKRLEKIYGGGAFLRCLKRRKSKVQKQLGRIERMENLKGRIYLCAKAPKTVLVIDDVITTGSTMEECSAVLKAGGAERVYGLCLFYN